MNRKGMAAMSVAAVAVAALVMHGVAESNGQKDVSSKTAESTVVTNDNGSVSRSFTECTVTTNGSMVIEHRRETRTNMDAEGNMLETSTSEYTQSYPVGDSPMAVSGFGGRGQPALTLSGAKDDKPAVNTDSFLGLKFGEEYKSDKFDPDPANSQLLRAKFTPKKPLADFDDYFVYVTPTTHRVAMVRACAKEAVDPGLRPRRHYLVEALEKKYGTWARLRSWWQPLYELDIGSDRHVRLCLSGATDDYETVIAAWDDAILSIAYDEHEAIREEARKAAADKRAKRVSEAQDAF